MRLLSLEDVAAAVGRPEALDAARDSARLASDGEVSVGRVSVPFDGGWTRILVAVVPSLDLWGYKEFHMAGGRDVRYTCHLFRTSTGEQLAAVDASLVTALRTAATAAIAVTSHFGDEPMRVAFVGSGAETRQGLFALAAAGRVAEARVTSPTPEHRDAFAREMQAKTGIPVAAAGSIAEAAAGADVVYSATNSRGRVVIAGSDLDGVRFVASLGSTMPAQRELAAEVLVGAGVLLVDTLEVLEESGDALAARDEGLEPARAHLLGEALAASPERLREGPGPVVYKSIGSPVQDVVLAYLAVELAEARGIGRVGEPVAALKRNLG